MTYWEPTPPMTATALILVCCLLSKTVFFYSSLPSSLILPDMPLFIQSLHSLCQFLIDLNLLHHTLLSAFWFLAPALWPLLSQMQVPPHSDFLRVCQSPSTLVFPSLESPDLSRLLLSAPGFVPSRFTLFWRNGACRVLPALVAQSKLNRIIGLFFIVFSR